MLKNVTDITSIDFSKGLNTVEDFFKLKPEETPNSMNVRFHFDGKISKRLGTSTMNSTTLSSQAGTIGVTTAGWASFDFGAGVSGIRWLVVAAGTSLWASSDLGVNFVSIATDRTSTYQYLERSKNVLVSCTDNYDNVLAWAGSAGTNAFLLNPSAPLAKYAINFRGFLLLMNTITDSRAIYYEQELSQLTGAFDGEDTIGGFFSLPSSTDDEITGAFILYNNLFVSTRYRLFKITYVGGNPDWSWTEIKNWGFVPRTVDKIYFGEAGELAMGLDWNKRIRVFDGLEDRIVSDKIENDNGMCDFATEKISYAGSGLTVSFGKIDEIEQTYKLGVAVGADSTQVTHMICFDGRTKAFYPYEYNSSNLMTMVMAESANRRFLMAVDQSGWVHMMDTGNLDGNTHAIDDEFDSSFLFDKSPSQFTKAHKIDMFFSVNSCGKVYFEDRVDFSSTFNSRRTFDVSSDTTEVQHFESIDIPSAQNTYQWRISSSSSTNDPWVLNRTDYFLKGHGVGREYKR